jgi:hypothetical protein
MTFLLGIWSNASWSFFNVWSASFHHVCKNSRLISVFLTKKNQNWWWLYLVVVVGEGGGRRRCYWIVKILHILLNMNISYGQIGIDRECCFRFLRRSRWLNSCVVCTCIEYGSVAYRLVG